MEDYVNPLPDDFEPLGDVFGNIYVPRDMFDFTGKEEGNFEHELDSIEGIKLRKKFPR